VPELKLGTFVWVNLVKNPGDISALFQNMLVPVIMSELAKVQPKHEVPPVEDFLGNYFVKDINLFNITKDDKTDKTGVYYGSVGIEGESHFWSIYDKKTTSAYGMNDTYFFRLFVTSDDSCFVNTMEGLDDGLVMFTKQQDEWSLIYMDGSMVGKKK